MLHEVSPEEHHTSIGCSTQVVRSAVGVKRVSRGWLLNVPFLVVILFFWDPEASAPDDESERSLPGEMLEVNLHDSSRNAISSPFPVPPLLVDLLKKNSLRSLDMMRWVSFETRHLVWTKKGISGSCRCVCRKSLVGCRICNDVTYGTCRGAAR